MGKKAFVPITGSVLKWAREESGLSASDLAEHLKLDTSVVEEWEEGKAQPSKTQFNAIVDFLRRPSAIFFLPEPPLLAALPTTFRKAPGLGQHKLNRQEVRQIRWARRLQEISSWALRESAANKITLPKYSPSDDPEVAGEKERAKSGIDFDQQLKWKDSSEAFAEWRSHLENQGILVLQLQLGKGNTRGLSAWDEHAPLVGVNSAYHPNARIFTLFHEVAHLFTRSDSACLRFILPGSQDNKIERWCERYAAAFLLPGAALELTLIKNQISAPITDIDFVRKFAGRLKVSSRALALRLQTIGLAPQSLYAAVEEELKFLDWNQPGGGGGGTPAHERRLAQVGERLSEILFDAYRQGLVPRKELLDSLRLGMGPAEDLERALSA